MTENRVPVMVVGGGPVGLAMGLALGRFGVPSLVVERNPTTTEHPKSRGCWVRTMEVFRRWGVEPQIRARGLADGTDVFVYMDRVTGTEYGRTRPEPRADQSPTWKSMVAQDAVEEELLAAIRQQEVATVRFSSEVTEFEDLGDQIRASVRNVVTGETETWCADWLIAADGAGSGTRRTAGIEMDGPPVLAVLLNEYVRADLSALPVAQEAAGIFLVPRDPAEPSVTLLNTNGADRWLVITRIGAERDEREHPFTDDEVQDLVRRYAGMPDLAVTRINSSTWRMSKQTARQFRKGRVLRMALVEQAARSGNQDRIDFWIDDLDNHLHSVGQSLGFIYEEGAVIPDYSTPPPVSSRYYTPVDRPGSRFPHLWLDDTRTESTLDWFDRDFTLVVGEDAADWARAGEAVARSNGTPLVVKTLPAGGEASGCKLGHRGAALVRPDGHVAWRTAWGVPDPQAELTTVLHTLLG